MDLRDGSGKRGAEVTEATDEGSTGSSGCCIEVSRMYGEWAGLLWRSRRGRGRAPARFSLNSSPMQSVQTSIASLGRAIYSHDLSVRLRARRCLDLFATPSQRSSR